MQRKRKGFTLLEILLVIAAIGILASIVLVAINPNKQLAQARNAKRRADINTLYKALEQYLIEKQGYPSGITGTEQDICINGNTSNCVNLGVLVPDYVAGIPVDPDGTSYKIGIVDGRVRVRSAGAELGVVIALSGSGGTVLGATGASDPYWNNVSLLLNFDGANGSTTFTDRSPTPNTVIAVGDAQISTTQSKFGGASGFFDGNGDFLTLNSTNSIYNFDGNFTIEGWFYKIDNGDDIIIASPQGGPSNNQIFRLSGNSIGIHQNGIWVFYMESYPIPLNTWHHFAYTRSGINNYLFVNGNQVGSVQIYSGIFRVGSIGRDIWGINQYNGYIDDLRITKGVARYTSNFTPPTESFPTN